MICSLRSCLKSTFTKQYSRAASTVKLAYTEYQPLGDSHGTDSTPLVILHGLFGSKTNWQILSKKFAKNLNMRVLTVDTRNHGDSPHTPEMAYSLMMEDVAHLLDSLNIASAHILAHSMGGRTAMRLALLKPAYLKSLIIEDVIPNSGPPNHKQYMGYMDAMKSLDLRMSDGSLANLRQRAMVDLEAKIPNIGVRAFLVQNLKKVAHSDMAEWKFNLHSIYDNWYNMTAQWTEDDVLVGRQYTGPTCFIGGAKSPYLPNGEFTEEERDRITMYFPSSECHVVPEAGHWVHSERPDPFLEIVCRFLLSLS